jgi:hypothetical protein
MMQKAILTFVLLAALPAVSLELVRVVAVPSGDTRLHRETVAAGQAVLGYIDD